MQVQPINNHARKRYSEFDSAMEAVRVAVDELMTTAKKFRDRADGRFNGWQVPTKNEVVGAVRKASDDLDGLRKNARKYRAELVSRGWRV